MPGSAGGKLRQMAQKGGQEHGPFNFLETNRGMALLDLVIARVSLMASIT